MRRKRWLAMGRSLWTPSYFPLHESRSLPAREPHVSLWVIQDSLHPIQRKKTPEASLELEISPNFQEWEADRPNKPKTQGYVLAKTMAGVKAFLKDKKLPEKLANQLNSRSSRMKYAQASCNYLVCRMLRSSWMRLLEQGKTTSSLMSILRWPF